MAPGTEFARDFCAGIGPLQLGVVLVSLNICFYMTHDLLGKETNKTFSHSFTKQTINTIIHLMTRLSCILYTSN